MESFQTSVLNFLNSIFLGCPHLGKKEASYILQGNLSRSALFCKVADILKMNKAKLLPYVALVELVHSVSLLQDDIIDGSPTRRGKPTIHSTVYAPRSTLFLTTYILTKGILHMILRHPHQRDFLQIFSKSIQEICLGEMSQDFSKDHSISQAIFAAKKKTGELFSLTFHICSFTKRYSSEFCEISKKIGMLYGLIFQIKDDLQDLFEDQIRKETYKSFPTLVLENIQKEKKLIDSTSHQNILLKKEITKIVEIEKKEILQTIDILSTKEQNSAYLLLSLVDEIVLSLKLV